jgi:hypothetical protein
MSFEKMLMQERILVSAKINATADTAIVWSDSPNAGKISSEVKKAIGAGIAKQSTRSFFIKKTLIPLRTHMKSTSS